MSVSWKTLATETCPACSRFTRGGQCCCNAPRPAIRKEKEVNRPATFNQLHHFGLRPGCAGEK